MLEHWYQFVFLFVAGGAAGLIDSIAGGGGLITVPALLLAGLDPRLALGTNKFQSSFGSFTASVRYARAGEVQVKRTVPGIVFTLIGAATGSALVQVIRIELLDALIPFLLLAILLYTVFSPRLGAIDSHPRMKEGAFYCIFGLAMGFYDGFFGPGTGSIWVIAFMLFLGQNLKKATAHTKIMNFTSNVVALAVFVIGGNVLYSAGLVMAVGQIIGARIGSGMVIKRGAEFIRPIFITMVALATLKLFWDRFGG